MPNRSANFNSRQINNQFEQSPKHSSGWDMSVAAFALACMTTGFWRLWPGALMLEDAPLGPMILKAGLAALGFVAIAMRWEETLRTYLTNPTAIVVLVLALVSPLWALNPADALRNAILLVVIWGFGIALTLRFQPSELAEICAFAGIFGILAQFIAHQGLAPSQASDGDLAFAVLALAWAAWLVPQRRLFWLLGLVCCAALAVAARDMGALGAGLGLVLGLGLAKAGAVARRGGAVSVIMMAWVICACIVGVTVFALFGAQLAIARIGDFFGAMGSHSILGQGFGSGNNSIAGAFGVGLGIVGICTVLLAVFATLFQALLRKSNSAPHAQAVTAVWFATLGAMIVSPHEVAVFGPLIIAFVASSFSIALSCVPSRAQRIPLMARSSVPPDATYFNKTRLTLLPLQPPAHVLRPNSLSHPPMVNSLGLKPKI